MDNETMRRLHGMVWQLRAEIGDRWKTPNVIDSARFCLTECAEALDAHLRDKGGYARNNAKQMTVHGELAQAAMMAFTVFGPPSSDLDEMFKVEPEFPYLPPTIDMICELSGRVLGESVHDSAWLWNSTRHLIAAIAAYPGMDLEAELTACLANVRRKHGGEK